MIRSVILVKLCGVSDWHTEDAAVVLTRVPMFQDLCRGCTMYSLTEIEENESKEMIN